MNSNQTKIKCDYCGEIAWYQTTCNNTHYYKCENCNSALIRVEKPPMKIEELVVQLKDIKPGDTEANHGTADDLLMEYFESNGHLEVVEAFEAIDKWYA